LNAKVTVRPSSPCFPSRTAHRPIPPRAVELPRAVKRHLGLDDDRSWIVVAEGNEFLWPGYDLRKIPNTDRYDYGFLPPRLFNTVMRAFVAWSSTGRRRLASRE
jgi:hypothetical protein